MIRRQWWCRYFDYSRYKKYKNAINWHLVSLSSHYVFIDFALVGFIIDDFSYKF